MKVKSIHTSLIKWFAVLSIVAMVVSCQEERYLTGEPNLKFSTDTVSFDTIFTTQGSATYHFKVYNPHSQPVLINSVELIGGDQSAFSLNVDGQTGNEITDVEVLAKDSIYIFVQVAVDPQNSNFPVLIEDSIEFIANNSVNHVKLLAYGQDAVHIKAERDKDYVLMFSETWNNTKPYLVHDDILLDSLSELKIQAGTQIFFRKDKSLHILGTLTAKGTAENPVVFRGARMDDLYSGLSYNKVPGQWGYIHLHAGSRDNVIEHARIRNSIVGIQVDTVVNENPTLTIRNTRLENATGYGLLAQGAHVVAENCLFANCGQYTVALVIGGKYSFKHCTIGNYYNYSFRDEPSLLLNNFYQTSDKSIVGRDLTQAEFINCIIYGNNSEEILLSNSYEDEPVNAAFNYYFRNCVIRTWQNVDTIGDDNFVDIYWNRDPKFIDPRPTESANFQLDTLSSAQGEAYRNVSGQLPFDLLGNPRLIDKGPDIGAFERDE